MHPKLNVFARFVSAATFFLIVAGAMVTSTGSGLAVPDWPLSFGQFFPEMKGGVFFEHGHRMIAGAVGVLTLLLSASLWKLETRRWVIWLGAAALGAVALQALLGGITVLYGLPPYVSIFHAVLAQTFFCLTVAIAVLTSRAWISHQTSGTQDDVSVRNLAMAAAAAVYAQLILGAGLRHGGGLLFLQLHIGWAVAALSVLSALIALILTKHPEQTRLVAPARILGWLLFGQILLGVAAFLPMLGKASFLLGWTRTAIVTGHVALGAAILAVTFYIVLWSFRIRQDQRERRTIIVTGPEILDPSLDIPSYTSNAVSFSAIPRGPEAPKP